jgi:uncharacterized protein YecT (DUF1311 family)
MGSLFRTAFVSLLLIGCSQVPCWAQHMNSPEAPCRHVVVTAELTQCFDHAYKNVDRDLNKIFADIRAVLAPTERQNLEESERAWLKYRDATCVAERKLYDGGTGAFPAFAACLEEETRQHVSDLHATYGWRIEKSRPY